MKGQDPLKYLCPGTDRSTSADGRDFPLHVFPGLFRNFQKYREVTKTFEFEVSEKK